MKSMSSESPREFIAAITDPHVRDFVDLRKLTKSEKYRLAVDMAVEHANTHGDFGYLTKILRLLGRGTHADSYLEKLRERVVFVVGNEDGVLTLKKSLKAKSPELPTTKKSPVSRKAPKQSPVRMHKNAPSEDLMDSRLMLPGSYGSGKRR